MSFDDVHALTEGVLRSGIMLSQLFGDLLDELPDDAFPGENTVDVLVEMLAGTISPVAEAAGPHIVREMTALLGALNDRVVGDLRAAVALAESGDP